MRSRMGRFGDLDQRFVARALVSALHAADFLFFPFCPLDRSQSIRLTILLDLQHRALPAPARRRSSAYSARKRSTFKPMQATELLAAGLGRLVSGFVLPLSPLLTMRPPDARQYLLPVAIPVALSLVIGLLTLPSGVLSSNFMYGSTAASDTVPVQGGQWAKELHQIVRPTCHNTSTVPWAGSTRTALVSFPRSGNSYTRSLVERATGFQTSSICEHSPSSSVP